jgi:hypothetical protein
MKEDNEEDSSELIFFNQALEYFDYPVNQNSVSIVKSKSHLAPNHSDLLKDEMLYELNRLKELIINNPDIKLEALNDYEKKLFFDFIKKFSLCPICRSQNHYLHLKELFFSEEKKRIKQSLISLMRIDNHKFKFNYGVPCCNCFKKYIEKE